MRDSALEKRKNFEEQLSALSEQLHTALSQNKLLTEEIQQLRDLNKKLQQQTALYEEKQRGVE